MLTGHDSTIWDADFSRDGELIATASEDKNVYIWKHLPPKSEEPEKENWERVSHLDGHTRTVYSVSFSKTGPEMIATACSDDCLRVFIQRENYAYDPLCNFEHAHMGDINSVAFNPHDHTTLCTCGDDNMLRIWKIVEK
eukprot:TRINITY_DN1899_c0_g1_i3.p1 TRINITY_DN1899_c0_g1~~TRINITY_DN1899_c0_g1_i3.p1  ORF type:complete len:139 (-),score=35.66 TRINITY_DN1899_c0_g1_i3:78-494(-)